MGSAAVLVVYAAGYLRTGDAAAAIEREAAARPSRGSASAPPSQPDPAGAGHSAVDSRISAESLPETPSVQPDATPPPVITDAPKTPALSTPDPRTAPATIVKEPAHRATAPTGPDSTAPSSGHVAAPKSPKAAAASPTMETAAKGPVDSQAAAAVKGSSVASGATATSDSTAPAASAAAPDSAKASLLPLRDGTFTGYGTSRHGDIEATVEIRDGRIATATISQCLTRYSCSWIEMLPAQVVARQTADVDIVSGATQSSDAFYFAILSALRLSRGT